MIWNIDFKIRGKIVGHWYLKFHGVPYKSYCVYHYYAFTCAPSWSFEVSYLIFIVHFINWDTFSILWLEIETQNEQTTLLLRSLSCQYAIHYHIHIEQFDNFGCTFTCYPYNNTSNVILAYMNKKAKKLNSNSMVYELLLYKVIRDGRHGGHNAASRNLSFDFFWHICRGFLFTKQYTYKELGEKAVPRLRESRLLTPSGSGWQVHAT